jgi:hypothetical protein
VQIEREAALHGRLANREQGPRIAVFDGKVAESVELRRIAKTLGEIDVERQG